MVWEGFYYELRLKKRQLQDPLQGTLPLDPQDIFAPSNNLPWRHPCLHVSLTLSIPGKS